MPVKVKTNAEFIQKVNIVFNYKYDYSQTNYIGRRHAIIIICPDHGSFSQRADSHLNGCGCPKCFRNTFSKSQTKSLETFIEEANISHNFKYDYSKSKYIKWNVKIEIICPEHGLFYQKPTAHIQGSGCPECGKFLASFNRTYSTEEYIKVCTQIHDDKYDYSKIVYTGYNNYVTIICLKHGEFKQRANNHLCGLGCRLCSKTNVSDMETKWLNYLKIQMIYRQYTIKINNIKYKVDGFDPKTNAIYEFYGDFWHGNPNKFNGNKINVIANKTFQELYEETIQRENVFKTAGYQIISIWESDWKLLSKSLPVVSSTKLIDGSI